MNVDEAITAHSPQKIRLQGVINGTRKEVLEPLAVGTDDACVLGRWIHSEARQPYSNLPEYPLLVQLHAEFHRCAVEVLRMAQAGQREKAKASLETGGVFMDASIRTITAIRQRRCQVERG